MNVPMSVLLCLLCTVFLLGAVLHERDIQRVCKEKGRSGHATWLGQLECSPITKEPTP